MNIRPLRVGEISTEAIEAGSGKTLLLLHAGEGPDAVSDAYLSGLAAHFRVIAPWHPGFGPSERPPEYRDVADLAYFYLELAEALELRDAVLVGASFGGWIAAEMAVRSTERFASLVLVDPFGVKAGDRDAQDIADFFAMTHGDWIRLSFEDPKIAERDIASMSDAELVRLLKSRESMAYYGWKPFMHSPQLRRWLHRIRIPTLVLRGDQDRVVSAHCHRLYASEIPGAKLQIIGESGHFPHLEQPAAFVRAVAAFAADVPVRSISALKSTATGSRT
jgi:pimeloyl-ACP methyl ester carboxylesterase